MEEEGGREKICFWVTIWKPWTQQGFIVWLGSPINQEGEDYFEVNWG